MKSTRCERAKPTTKLRLRMRRLERAGLPPIEQMFFEPGDVRSGKARRDWFCLTRRRQGVAPPMKLSAKMRSMTAWAALLRDFPPQVPNPYAYLLTPETLWDMCIED